MKLHKSLTAELEEEFRQWARDNYEAFTEIKGVWHPVVQAECVKINDQADIDCEIIYDKEGNAILFDDNGNDVVPTQEQEEHEHD